MKSKLQSNIIFLLLFRIIHQVTTNSEMEEQKATSGISRWSHSINKKYPASTLRDIVDVLSSGARGRLTFQALKRFLRPTILYLSFRTSRQALLTYFAHLFEQNFRGTFRFISHSGRFYGSFDTSSVHLLALRELYCQPRVPTRRNENANDVKI